MGSRALRDFLVGFADRCADGACFFGWWLTREGWHPSANACLFDEILEGFECHGLDLHHKFEEMLMSADFVERTLVKAY